MSDDGVLDVLHVAPERDDDKKLTGNMIITYEDGSAVRLSNEQSNGLARYWTKE